MSHLKGRVALITGGSRGIGAATARALAKEGADVVITYGRSRERAEQVVAEIEALGRRALAVQSDQSKRGSAEPLVKKVLEAFGQLDVVVAAAGVFGMAPISGLTDEAYDQQFDVNVRGVFELVRAASPALSDGGRIITLSSIMGPQGSFVPGNSLYSATKAAVTAFTKGWARDFAPRGITVNAIQPGPIDTELNPDSPENPGAEMMKGATALGRYGKAEEVAALAVFLASPEASYITGQGISVDGGWTA